MLGKYIKFMRIERGMTQTELAKKLFIAPCTLSHYEVGTRMTPYSVFELALKVCNFSFNIIDCKTKKNITMSEIVRMTNK